MQPTLNTIEITVNQTKVLRNNINAILDAEDTWRHYYKTNKKRKNSTKRRKRKIQISDDHSQNSSNVFTFHTPLHCSAAHGEGEFVFIGRRRFQEMMLICAPRLDEWVYVSARLNQSDNAPCILNS